ncbi:MAG: metallophosphatase family protein [Candidatus Gastranaerophilales bacterium]|nr:metallophosphatase family protein [Candidatus Gastranaerophilales bacterium]
MKIAIISDLHGNDEALTAVLEDIKAQKCDKIFCLGDLAMAGPEPSKVVNKVKEMLKQDNFLLIQGNTDEKLGTYSKSFEEVLDKNVPVMANAYRADLKALSAEDKEFLANLPEKLEVEENGVKILLCHGSPRKNDENITNDLTVEQVEEIVADTDAEVIFCGHTHVPCGYATNTGKTVVNAGSVGRPFAEVPKSCYAVINISLNGDYEIEHRLIKYDIDTASEKLRQRGFDGAEKLAAMLVKATSRYPK